MLNDYSSKPGIFCEEIIFQYAHLREWGSCNTYETYATLFERIFPQQVQHCGSRRMSVAIIKL